MLTAQLKKDFEYCEKIMKKASKSFYYAFSQLPEKKAKSIYAIYAFCRIVDDSIDEEPNHAVQIQKIEHFKSQLAHLHEIDEPIYRALSHVFNTYNCFKEPYYEQIAGQESDVAFKQPENLSDFIHYSDLVAGSVGRMLLPVLATQSELTDDLIQSASELGIAMQITNILRDIGEDYRERRRIYLPKDLMQQFGYSEHDLKQNNITDAFINLWETLAKEAEARYDHFFSYLHHYDEDTREHIRKSALVYREILNVIREQNYNCLTKRQYVSIVRMKKVAKWKY